MTAPWSKDQGWRAGRHNDLCVEVVSNFQPDSTGMTTTTTTSTSAYQLDNVASAFTELAFVSLTSSELDLLSIDVSTMESFIMLTDKGRQMNMKRFELPEGY